MAKYCNGMCGTDPVTMPFAVHENDMARIERNNKRLLAVVIVLIASLIITNLAWIIYESQMTDISIEQEVEQQAKTGRNIVIGGDYYGETESEDEN